MVMYALCLLVPQLPGYLTVWVCGYTSDFNSALLSPAASSSWPSVVAKLYQLYGCSKELLANYGNAFTSVYALCRQCSLCCKSCWSTKKLQHLTTALAGQENANRVLQIFSASRFQCAMLKVMGIAHLHGILRQLDVVCVSDQVF